mmetsp:Transcript_56696/g.143605  ORF Transcript_56696/g.143605 Transcript_56696/m.143605 type:complete len:241 (-) Transcript_56696:5684-6406(-)
MVLYCLAQPQGLVALTTSPRKGMEAQVSGLNIPRARGIPMASPSVSLPHCTEHPHLRVPSNWLNSAREITPSWLVSSWSKSFPAAEAATGFASGCRMPMVAVDGATTPGTETTRGGNAAACGGPGAKAAYAVRPPLTCVGPVGPKQAVAGTGMAVGSVGVSGPGAVTAGVTTVAGSKRTDGPGVDAQPTGALPVPPEACCEGACLLRDLANGVVAAAWGVEPPTASKWTVSRRSCSDSTT